MAKCTSADHARAMKAMASLSKTQFGRAALERHGHVPFSVEEAREHEKTYDPKEEQTDG